MTAQWYNPCLGPYDQLKKRSGFIKPTECKWRKLCLPSATELDLGLPTDCQSGLLVELPKNKKRLKDGLYMNVYATNSLELGSGLKIIAGCCMYSSSSKLVRLQLLLRKSWNTESQKEGWRAPRERERESLPLWGSMKKKVLLLKGPTG